MLDYDMEKRGGASLYEYLYQCIRTDIKSGVIVAGEHLPSKRLLADHLGISVITVENAYAQLVAEGYVYSKPRSGFYAAALPVLTKMAQPTSVAHDRKGPEPSLDMPLPGNYSQQAAKLWSQALRSTLSCEPESELYCISPAQGIARLRSAIANHLRQNRGMSVNPENIIIGAGAQVLDIMLAQLFGREAVIGLEDPGYTRLTHLYESAGLEVCHIPLDKEGIRPQELENSRASILHIMPSHQFPTGTVTSIARRYELLGWASAAQERYIIEDDYDCEFRLAGKPIPSLASIDVSGRVIYTNTFSKSLSSALRLAYMVLPNELTERYRNKLAFYSSTLSTVQQVALARLLESGDYERHVNRIRKQARDRRDALLNALNAPAFAGRITIEAKDAGLHFVITLDEPRIEQKLVAFLQNNGAQVTPLREFASTPKIAQSPTVRSRLCVQF